MSSGKNGILVYPTLAVGGNFQVIKELLIDMCYFMFVRMLLHSRFDVPSMSLLCEMFTFTFLLSNQICLMQSFGGYFYLVLQSA